MVVLKMDLESRDKVLELIKLKDKIEFDIRQNGVVLETNKVGMHDSLVDADGFPRNDIDVYQVRQARHRIICLQNDLKAVMLKIENGLHSAHAPLLESGGSTTSTSSSDGGRKVVVEVVSNHTVPIVRVNLVSPGSPAEEAGILLGDLVTQFGSVNSDNFKSLHQIGQIVNNSINKSTAVTIKRDENIIKLHLVPKPWSGQGYLGCNIVPLDDYFMRTNVER